MNDVHTHVRNGVWGRTVRGINGRSRFSVRDVIRHLNSDVVDRSLAGMVPQIRAKIQNDRRNQTDRVA